MKAKNKKLELRKLASAIKVSSFAYAGLFAGLISPIVHAGPEGGVVTGGSGTIDVDGATTTVDQVTDLLSIDWDSFNLSEEELIQFLQPDSSSIVLNRILDQDVTTIQGAIEANGHVILVNPRGVLFTETATVNVGAITASGLDMSPEDFMNGDFAFKGESGSSGVVVNRGVINASSAILVGKQVTNSSTGLISAELVSLAAADEALLTFDADGMIGIKVTKEVMENDLGLDSAVLNEGAIEGAQVLMEASVSGDLFTAAVNNEGTITARGIDTSGGKIRLFGSGSGVVSNGTLDASGSAGGEVVLEGDFAELRGDISVAADSGNGGDVAVLGDEVIVSGNINASGTSSGGKVLIGGDYQGNNVDIRNAETTTVTADAYIDASGVGNADGGTVIVWSDVTTKFGGTVLAESGTDGGDGGLIETSGKIYLDLDEGNMSISTLSHGDGENGLWLLDPGWMDIIEGDCSSANCISVTSLVTALSGSDVEILLTDEDSGSGPDGSVTPADPTTSDFSDGIRVLADIDWDEDTTLTLNSYSNVLIESGYSITNDTAGGLEILAGGDFTNAGNIAFDAGLLDVKVGGAFTNSATISAADFLLNVGYQTGSNTTNTLGDIFVTGTGTVTGGTGTDIFTLSDSDNAITITGDNAFTLDTLSFNSVEEVDLGGGDNSIVAIDATTLTGVDNEAETSLITFSNIDSISTSGSLTGSENDDTFVVISDTEITANEISVENTAGFSAINAAGGEDNVIGEDGERWTLTSNDNEAESSDITFSDVEILEATNTYLRGTSGIEEFVLTSGGDVAVNGMTVSGMTEVRGRSGDDTLDATAFDAGLALNGESSQVTAGSLLFKGITDAETLTLTGTSGNESFTVNSDNAVTVNGIAFTDVSTVDGGTGSDSVTTASTVTLTGTSNEAISSLITFSDIDSISTSGSLTGSENDDTFVVISDTEITANEISVENTAGFSAIDAAGGNDSVTGASGESWTLTSNDNEAETSSGITFSDVETLVANSASLQGTASVEEFVLTSGGNVEVNGMTVSGMSEVVGNNGDDTLNASAYTAGLTLTDTANKVTAGSLNFSGIVSAVTSLLTGTSGDESFTVNGDNAVTANGIAFTDVITVDGGTGSDSVTTASTVTLTGTSNEAISSLITFSDIDSISTSGSLTGSENDDTFVVVSTTEVTANGISVENTAGFSAIDAAGGNDSVTGASGESWTLTSNDNEAETSSGITFSDVETLVANSASLQGTASVEEFVLTSGGNVEVNGMTVSGMSEVVGNNGDDTLNASAYTAGLTLTDTANKVTAGSLNFSGIVSAVTSLLTGTSGDESFTVNGDNAVTANGIAFTDVSTVDGGTGSDSVTTASTVTLTGTSNEAISSLITFSDIDSISTSGSLTGSENDDTFVVISDTEITANEISVENTAGFSAIDAAGGNDSVTGASGESWTLTSNDNEAETSSGITFSDVETLVANSASLQGTASVEEFVLTSGGNVEVNGMTVSGMSEVVGNNGDDTLDASAYTAGLTLTDTANKVTAGSLNFSGIVSAVTSLLTGTSDDESFTVNGDNAVTANGIAFTDVSTVDTGNGTDSVTGATGVDWTLTSNDNEAESSEITFSGVETLVASSANLQGTANVEDFVLTSAGDVEVNGMTVSGMSEVAGNSGDDTLDASAYSAGLTLTDTANKVTTGSLNFSGIVSAVTSLLTGTSDDESFTVNGDNAVTANGIAFTDVSTVDTGNGTDSVTGATGADWTLTSNDNEAESSEITFSGVETLVASSANLQGTANVEDFVLTSAGDVEVNGMTVSGMSEVFGNDGSDTLDAKSFDDGLTLTDTDNKVIADTLVFYNITDAVSSALIGTSGADSFTVTGNNALNAAGISFTEVDTVDAGTGSDSLTAIDTVVLTGTDYEATSSLITFSDIESVSGGSLEASSGDDTFEVTGFESLKANQIAFSDIDSVDAMGGTDSVTGVSGEDWTLGSSANEATNNGITFTDVETLVASSANLQGTASVEEFVLTSGGDVEVNGMTVSGMSEVVGNGGNDTLDASAYTAGLTLTDTANKVTAGSLNFSGIVSAVTSLLTGTSDDESFTVNGDNAVTANGIAFTDVSTVDGGTGSDSVTTVGTVTLTGTSNEAISSLITFSDIDSISAGGSLVGSANDDTFVVVSTTEVTANGISVENTAGFSAIDAAGGNDSVTGASGESWTLTSNDNEAETSSGITFSDVETLVANSASLQGTASVEEFVLTSGGNVEVNGMTVSGMSEVVGNNGDDTLDASAYTAGLTLTDTANKVTAGSLNFSGIVSAVTSLLTGTSDDESFTVNGDNAVTANGIAFTDVSTVDTGNGTDSVTGATGVDWTLTSNDNEAESSEITFSGVETLVASSANLQGTANVEDFVLTSAGDVEVNGMTVSGMSEVAGNSGDDTLDASAYSAGLALTGTNNQVTAESGSLTFDGIVSAVTSALTGSSGADSFTVDGDNEVTSYNIAFTNVSTIDGSGDVDSVTGANGENWTLTGTDNQATGSGITFNSVEALTATNASLVGTAGADSFILQSDADVEVYGMTVSGMSAVEGNGGSDSLNASAYSDGLALTGTDYQVTAESGNLVFNDIASAVTSALTGTSGADSFTVDGDNEVTSYEIAFTGVSTVDAGNGTDSVTALSVVTLTGTDNQATTNSILFSNIDSVSGGSLQASSSDDSFEVTGTNALTANEIAFSSISSVDALGGDDSVIGADGKDWTLTGTNYEAINNGITFSNVEILTAVNANLVGTASADAFVLQSDADVAIYNMTISGMSSVEGNGGSDSLDASAYSDGLALTGTDYQVTAESGSLVFNDIFSAATSTLTGTSGADSFTVNGDNEVSSYEIAFIGVNTVDAGSGSDSVVAQSVVTLTGTGNEATTNSIDFLGIDSVTGGSLEGSDNADTFVVTSSTSVTANDISFSGFSGDIDAKGGVDSVTGLSGQNWILTGTDYQATGSGITFSSVEALTATNASLVGTAGADSFILQSDADVEVYGMTVSGMSAVEGNGGSDSLNASAYSDGLALTGTDYQVTAESGNLVFNDIASAVTSALTGTSGADSFTVDGDNEVTSYEIAFTGVSTVDAGNGTDSVTALSVVTLTGTDNQASTNSILFSNIDSVSGGSLQASSGDDSFEVTGTNALTANEIAFSSISSVDALGGDDSVIGADGKDWTLTGTNYEAINNGITFSNVEILTAVNANLVGTASADAFVLQSDADVAIYNMTISGMSSVEGNGGSDSLDASAYSDGLALTGTDYQVTAESGSLVFNDIFSAATSTLTGTSGADSFTVNGDNEVTSYEIAFTNVSTVDTGNGTDSVTGATGADWTLTSNDNEAESSEITFSGVETLVASNANLQGTANVEDFVLTSAGDVEVNGMTVSGMSEVAGNSGDDTLDASAYSAGLALTGTNNQVTAESGSLTFDGIVSAVTSALTGSSGADSFTVDGDNEVTSYNIAFTNVSTIDGSGDVDSVTGANGENWTLTGTDNQATGSGITFNSVEALTATNASLVGTAGADSFILQSDADVEVYGMTVSGMSAVEGNGGSDSLNASAYSDGLALTGTDYQVTAESGNLVFNDIASAVTSALTGTSGADSFTVDGDNEVTSYEIAFTGVSTVDAGNGTDSVTALSVVTLTGTDNQATTNSILFSNIDSVSGGSLQASSSDDSFEVTGTNALTANEIAFSSISSVDALGGDDSVIGADGKDWTLTGTNYEAINNGITFSNVEILTAVNANLVGTASADAFVLQSDADVAIYNMTISGMSSVEGNGGSDSLDASAYSDGLALTGTDYQVTAESGSLVFNDIFSAATSTLTGTSGADSFTVNGDNEVTSYEIAFTNVSTVDTGNGTDSVTGATGADWTLTSNDNEAESSEITFSGVETLVASNANLQGTANVEDFVLTSAGDVEVNGMTVSGMSEVAGNSGDDTLDASAYSAGLALTGTNNQVTAESGSLTFDGIVSAVTSALTGSSGADSFTVDGDNEVTSYNIAFTSVSTIDGSGDVDSVTGANGENWTLTGTDNQATGSGITFNSVEALTATNASLIGTAGADSFILQSDGDVEVYGMTVSGMSAVEGNGGSDSLNASAYSDGLALTGTDYQVTAESGNLVFNDIASAVTSALTGTSGADSFTIDGDNEVTSYEIAFTGVSTVDAGNGADSVTGVDGASWTLTGADNEAISSSITFNDIESIAATNSDLLGSAGADEFVLRSDADIEVYDLLISGISEVDGNGGSDSLDASAYSDGLALTGTDYQVTAESGSLVFNNIASAVTSALTGTSGADSFTVDGDNEVTSYEIAFTGVSTVDAGNGTDSVTALSVVTLTGTDNQASTNSILFSNIDSVSGGSLQASSSDDSFEVTGTNALTANEIAFSSISSVDALGGDDSVIGADGKDWTLTGTNYEAINNGITFSNVEILTAVNANLVGTASADAFVLQSDADVAIYNMTISGMSSVEGNGGSDSLDASAYSDGLALTGTDYQVTAESGSLVFNDIFSAATSTLTGTSGADSFTVNGDNEVTSYEIAFTNVSTVDTGNGTDSVTGATGADWTLTSNDNEAESSEITFSGVETLVASNANLQGTANVEDFVLTSAGDVEVNGMTVSGMSEVAGNSGDDTLDASAYSAGLALTGTNNQVTAESGSLTFDGIVSAVTSALTGSSGADSFTVDGDNEVTSYNIAFTSVSTIDGSGDVDSVTGANGENWTLTGTDNQATGSGITFNSVEALTATNASLIGTAGADSFILQSDGDVEVYGMTVSGMSAVEGNGGSDSLNASAYSDGLALTGTSNEVTAESGTLTFDGIFSATTATLTATNGSDNFTVDSDNATTIYGIAFTGLNSIDAGEGADSVTGASGADWTLTGNDYEATNSSITFSNVETITAVNANLVGTANADTFVLQSVGDIEVYGMNVSGMSAVDGNGGDDSLDASAYSDGLTLTGSNGQVTAGSLAFSSIASAVTSSLTGTSGADNFTVDGDNAISSYDIAFTGVSTLDADGGTDSVIGADGADWTLSGTDNQAASSGIIFSNVDSLTTVNAELVGTTSADAFVLQSGGDVEVYDMTISGMFAVDGNGGGDSLDASSYSDGLKLTGASNQVAAGSLTFDGIASAVASTLTGTSGADSITVNGDNAVTSYDIVFAGVSTIDTGTGTDSVTGADGEDWTLTGSDNQATGSGITFSNIDSLTAVNADLIGTTGADDFVLQSDADVEAYGIAVSGMSSVEGNGGNDSLDASAYSDGLALTGVNNQVTAESGALIFNSIFSAESSTLTATSGSDNFTIDSDNATTIYDIAFTGLSSIDAAGGADTVTGADGADWTLTGNDSEATNSGITFSSVETLIATNADLQGSSNADAFALQSTGDIEVYSMTVSGMSAVYGQGGNDSLDASAYSDGLALTGTDNQVTAGSLTFDGIVSAVTSALTGTSGADSFTVDGDNAATSYDIAFTGLSTINALGGNDTAIGADGADWSLTGADNEAVNSSITFSNIENLTAVNADLVATTGDDAFVLQSDADVEVYGMTVSGMSAVDGNGGDDSLDASAYSDGLSLTGVDNQVDAGSLSFYSISSAATSILTNTHDSAQFELQGDQALATAGISFTGLEEVNTSGSNDTLVATDSDDNFTLNSDGDISVAGIDFSGLETVDGAGGSDTVSADGATWTSTSSGNSLVEGSVEAEVNGLTVYFDNLELVEGAGSYTGQDIDGEYEFSALDTMTIGGVTFANLDSVAAGSGTDTVYGADIDTVWDINDSEHTVSSGGTSLTITGIESIIAGSGADEFNLNGGELAGIDTGAGSDTVTFSGTVIDSISLGAGNDFLTVETDIGQEVELAGGGGSDDFQYNLSGATWELYNSGNQVGNFSFAGFEYLDNTSDSITVLTDRAFDFEDGGSRSESFNKNGAGLQFSDMRLGYDGEGDIYVTSSSTDTIGGSLTADRAELVVGGDVDIETDVSVLAVATSGADINISVQAAGDLVIDEIDAGRGTVSLASSSFGTLTAETYGDTHITASAVTLGTETELWTIIGEATNPLRMDVTNTVDIYSVSYYEPDFIGQIPTVTSTGDELQSVAGAQASQGLKSAVQNAVEDFSHVDPAIFSAVKPYSSGVDAVNSPEMRLRSGELSPAVASAAEEVEAAPKFDAELELGTSDAPSDITVDLGEFNGGSAGH
ncbi:filamentous hemagglutinin N-terminal domain-containing protein [Microbulbifer sp. PAAF003]|uniref:filamentous hemagglutinin N-terminal domain-containing protein n=1 Tax=Microbulbifer sp. PAAF003 TaxID=3243375 RepID=UPI004039E75C